MNWISTIFSIGLLILIIIAFTNIFKKRKKGEPTINPYESINSILMGKKPEAQESQVESEDEK